MNRRSALLPLVILLVLALGYAGAWVFTAIALQKGSEHWIEARRQDGYVISYSAPKLSGFPARAAVTFADLDIAAPTNAGGWRWQTPIATIHTRPLNLANLTIDLAGTHALSGIFSAPGEALPVSFARADLMLDLNTSGRLDRALLEMANASVDTLSLEQGSVEFTLLPETAPDAVHSRLVVNTTNLALPESVQLPSLEKTVKSLRVTAEMKGALTNGSLPRVLDAWRQAGGALEVRDFAIDWPPVGIFATGTLALDENLQPIGAASAKFEGFFALIDSLVTEGEIRTSDAAMAKVVLGVLARRPEAGGPAELSLSLTLQDRTLFAGPVTLLQLDEIEWPDRPALPLP